jgi:Flp pilus assembly pilin Flp
MFHLIAQLRPFIRDERGAAMVEYAVIMALVIGIGAAVFTGLATDLTNIFTEVATQLAAVLPGI